MKTTTEKKEVTQMIKTITLNPIGKEEINALTILLQKGILSNFALFWESTEGQWPDDEVLLTYNFEEETLYTSDFPIAAAEITAIWDDYTHIILNQKTNT